MTAGAFSFDPDDWGDRVVDGQAAVTFAPCDDGTARPQYAGGFRVASPGCVRVSVSVGKGGEAGTFSTDVPFATKSCE